MKPIKTLGLCAFVGIVVTACHTKQAPPATATNPNTANAPVYATAPHNDSATVQAPKADLSIPDGPNVTKYPDGVIKMKGNYRSGLKEGEWQSFFPNGKLCSDEFFTAGYPDGKVTVYYDNEQEMYEGQYRNGKQCGIWKFWKKDSKTPRISDYDKKPTNVAL